DRDDVTAGVWREGTTWSAKATSGPGLCSACFSSGRWGSGPSTTRFASSFGLWHVAVGAEAKEGMTHMETRNEFKTGFLRAAGGFAFLALMSFAFLAGMVVGAHNVGYVREHIMPVIPKDIVPLIPMLGR